MAPAAVAALEYHGRWRVDARPDAASAARDCQFMLRTQRAEQPPALPLGWQLLSVIQRPSDRREVTQILRRVTAP
jgi:hypothetical protein